MFLFFSLIIYHNANHIPTKNMHGQVGSVEPNIFIYRTALSSSSRTYFFFLMLSNMQPILVGETSFSRQSARQLAYM
jgi:pyrroline-5-carboxylate reductase